MCKAVLSDKVELMKTQKGIATIAAVATVIFIVVTVGRHTVNRTTAADAPQLNPDSVFAMPQIQGTVAALRLEFALLFRQKKYQQAKRRCSALVRLLPEDPVSHYNLGCAFARLDRPDEAMASLTDAVKFGFRDPQHLQKDVDLLPLQDRADWDELLKATEEPFERTPTKVTIKPAVIAGGIATVGESNSMWDPRSRHIRSFFSGSSSNVTDLEITKRSDAASRLLIEWQKGDTAAGHVGVLYDNHDRDHSNFAWKSYPQLTRIEYSKNARQFNLDTGAQRLFFFNGIVFGNSSTAITDPSYWRSQARLMYSDPHAAATLATQYFGNHIYMYPEHRDYDSGTNGDGGFGDVFPANTPYVIISQGSSGSDRVFMDAVAATLAAFRTETRRLLAQKSALMPCVQMIFRTCNSQVETVDDYLRGIAHPPVFQGDQVNKVEMVKMAHDMLPEDLPPVAVIEVVDEDRFEVGRDYFEARPRESLFTTPGAVARVCRAVRQTRRMTVSAKKSLDLNQKPLTWHWVVLQGDPSLVEIEPQDESRSEARILVRHHQRRSIRQDSPMQSSRVDIGVFVHNGTYYSAPAMISFYWPENEVRQYREDGRVLSVEYKTMDRGGLYADPMLVTGRNWTDEYHYDEEQRLVGWDRIRGEQRQSFTTDGYLVTKKDDLGRPLEAINVRYVAEKKRAHPPVLRQYPGSLTFAWEYASDEDRVGTWTEVSAIDVSK